MVVWIGEESQKDVQVDWKAAMVMKKAEPYHETSPRLRNSVVMRGIAVATIVLSSRVSQHVTSLWHTHGSRATRGG